MVEVEQCGELRVLWVHRVFRTYLDVTEDARDPECLRTEFSLLRSVSQQHRPALHSAQDCPAVVLLLIGWGPALTKSAQAVDQAVWERVGHRQSMLFRFHILRQWSDCLRSR